jgi:hypothetical protein
MNRNRLSIRAWLGPLLLVLPLAGIVAGTLQWPVAVCYAIFVLTLVVALAATRAERESRRAR